MGNFHTSGPNTAIIVNTTSRKQKVKVGRTVWAWWIFNTVQKLKLELLTVHITSTNAESNQGVRLSVQSVAQIKVQAFEASEPGSDPQVNDKSILKAAELFLGEGDTAVRDSIRQTLEGHQRQIIGTLNVEDLFRDREKFANSVKETVVDDLSKMGLTLCSYVVQSIEDENGYMASLGVTQTAVVKRAALEGEALHDSAAKKVVAACDAEAEIAEAEESRRALTTQNQQKEAEAESERELQLKSSALDVQIFAAEVEAAQAGPIEEARQVQEIKREERKQEKVEEVVKLEIAEIIVQRAQTEREGRSAAELLAERNKAKGVSYMASAHAERTKLMGKAEADVIIKQGEAEAHVLEMKAAAYQQFGEAAVVEMIVNKLPIIAESLCKPLSDVKHLSFVSAEHEGGSHGVIGSLSSIPEAVENITGVDLRKAAQHLAGLAEKRIEAHVEEKVEAAKVAQPKRK